MKEEKKRSEEKRKEEKRRRGEENSITTLLSPSPPLSPWERETLEIVVGEGSCTTSDDDKYQKTVSSIE